jgi:hypothetical protein
MDIDLDLLTKPVIWAQSKIFGGNQQKSVVKLGVIREKCRETDETGWYSLKSTITVYQPPPNYFGQLVPNSDKFTIFMKSALIPFFLDNQFLKVSDHHWVHTSVIMTAVV